MFTKFGPLSFSLARSTPDHRRFQSDRKTVHIFVKEHGKQNHGMERIAEAKPVKKRPHVHDQRATAGAAASLAASAMGTAIYA